MNRVNAQQVDGKIVLGGEQPLYFRPHDLALADAGAGEVTGRVVGSFFAGSVTRIVVRLDDGQTLTVDALGHSRFDAGTAIGVVFNRPTPIGVVKA